MQLLVSIEQRPSESCFNWCLSGKAENIIINCALASSRFERVRVRVHIIVICARVRASVTNR